MPIVVSGQVRKDSTTVESQGLNYPAVDRYPSVDEYPGTE